MVENVLEVHRKCQVVAFSGVPAAAATSCAAASPAARSPTAQAAKAAASSSAASASGSIAAITLARLRGCASSLAAKSKRLTDSQIGLQGARSFALFARNNYFAERWIGIESAEASDDYTGLC